MTNPIKICSRCRLEKSVTEFYRGDYYCKECRKVHQRRYRDKNYESSLRARAEYVKRYPERVKSSKLKSSYGISLEDYNSLLEKQENACGICGGPPTGRGIKSGYFQVDHDHLTKKVRGLLCSNCNAGIGHLKDSISILESAIKYLGGEDND